MLESFLLVIGLALALAGAISFLYPLRWLGISTRGITVLVMAGGFLVAAIGTGMVDSYLVYLGLILLCAGLLSLIRPLRFIYIRTRRLALMVAGFGLLLSLSVLLLPYRNQEAASVSRNLMSGCRDGRWASGMF